MTKTRRNPFIVLVSILIVILALTGCSDSSNFNVVYDTGDGISIKPSIYDEGMSLPVPEKEGYTFDGWYLDSEYNHLFKVEDYVNYNSKRDITVYAKWNIITYNINYELADGLNHLSNPSSYTIETNTIILSAPTKEGYTFEGWYSDLNFTNYVSEITIGSIGNLTLYAKWIPNSYTAYYNIQSDNQYLLVDILLLPGETIIQVTSGGYHSAALTSSGRLFTWGLNDYGQLGDGTTSNRYSPTKITQAHYELLHSDTVIYNQSITEYVPTREGYTFSGWYSDINLKTPYIFGSMPAEDITLHGKWVSND